MCLKTTYTADQSIGNGNDVTDIEIVHGDLIMKNNYNLKKNRFQLHHKNIIIWFCEENWNKIHFL